jgi:hypothetical protein
MEVMASTACGGTSSRSQPSILDNVHLFLIHFGQLFGRCTTSWISRCNPLLFVRPTFPQKMLSLFRVVAASLLATTVVGDCAFTQKCYTHQEGCYPIPAVGDDTVPKPFSNNGTDNALPFVCPQYSESACCNGKQNLAIAENKALIQAAFNDLGGNMACVDNIVAMWCAFTCSPNQADFVQTQGFANMTAPFPGGEWMLAGGTKRVSGLYIRLTCCRHL